MWLDPEIIKPKENEKYTCKTHYNMDPKNITRGRVNCYFGKYYCDVYTNGVYNAMSMAAVYAYER